MARIFYWNWFELHGDHEAFACNVNSRILTQYQYELKFELERHNVISWTACTHACSNHNFGAAGAASIHYHHGAEAVHQDLMRHLLDCKLMMRISAEMPYGD